MGVFLSRLWGLRLIRRRSTNLLRGRSASGSDITGSCDSVLTCSTLDSSELELDGEDGELMPMSHPYSNLLQPYLSPFHAAPIHRVNQDLLLK